MKKGTVPSKAVAAAAVEVDEDEEDGEDEYGEEGDEYGDEEYGEEEDPKKATEAKPTGPIAGKFYPYMKICTSLLE